MDYFEKLLEVICLNHAYSVKHKLRDSGMMKTFMDSRSLARGMEVDEVLDEGDTMLILGEDAVMTIYDGCPHRVCVTCLT
jgi:histone acetyltransferase (RNA polymerase elongator complex component)